MMTPDQVTTLLTLLERIANKQFTISQASDWPILLFATGIFAGMIGSMWRDLGKKFDMQSQAMGEAERRNIREHDKIWSALRDCQEDCCNPKSKHEHDGR